MKLAVGVITAPRPRPTLNDSLLSYRDAGFIHVPTTVFADGKTKPNISVATGGIVHDGSKYGNLRNWHRALHSIRTHNQDADWLMVCEDDISWAARAYETLMSDLEIFMQSKKFASTGALSLYAPVRVTNDLERMRQQTALLPGWYAINHGLKTWGAQCLVFSREQASALMKCETFWYYLNSGKDKNVDAFVAESIRSRGLAIGYRIPCLVNHDLGDGNSSLGYPAERPALKTRYFADNL